tara:strand:+ start:106534 stop:106785 length:252 start_codon:yes stop_codon:yes gene_type:complete
MKNRFVFYSATLAPLIAILILYYKNSITSGLFITLIVIYALVYRPLLDAQRLVAKKIITQKESWRMLVPGFRLEYFREIYIKA